MDKNIIKNHLAKKFLSEEATPGISVTDKAKKESAKINKAGVKAIEKDVTSYDKALKQKDPNMNKMATNKYNYIDDAEKTYHNDMEILNGQEMIEYTSKPGEEFKKKSEEGMVGSSRMGNAIGGNAEAVWNASSDDFGKDLVKRVKASSKKRADAEIQTYGMGDVQIPTATKVQVATTAVGSAKVKGDTTKINPTQTLSDKSKIKTVKENNNNSQTKESMKRLKFKKEFEGTNTTQKIGHALTLIPESYKSDKKEFEITDGNVTCKIRWEGNISEGKAIVLTSANKTMISEDMSRMKQLMGYKSQDTLGLVKGNARIDENVAFSDIWKKTRVLLGESEEIETAKAATGDLDDAVKQAPEAKKAIEGSVSTEKGTMAPKPKTGEWEKNVKGQPSEAKKNIEGSVATEKKTEAPAPKEGEWNDISMPQAPEAKKHVHLKENEEIDGEEESEVEDTFYKSDDDDSAEEKEPTATDIKAEVPPAIGDEEDAVSVPAPVKNAPRLMVSKSTGDHYIMVGQKATLVDPKYLELAKTNTKLALQKMQDDVDFGTDEPQELDEYGDEHQISTSDALYKMKEKN